MSLRCVTGSLLVGDLADTVGELDVHGLILHLRELLRKQGHFHHALADTIGDRGPSGHLG